jgi:hypothetical protein
MRDESSIDPGEPLPTTEEERIRRLRVTELEATLDRIGAEAQARGLTEEIMNEILNEKLSPEEESECRRRTQEVRAFVAENLGLAGKRGLTEADVPLLISDAREERNKE